MRQTSLTAALVAAAALLLAACGQSGSSISEQMRQGDQKGYVAGDGTIESLAPEQRRSVLALEGTTLEGDPWSAADHNGEVVVINVWGSWCAPCIEETPDLVRVASDLDQAGEPVQFVGVNSRDSVPSALVFEETHGIPYPSLQDDGGRTRAQLGGLAVATPSTILLDGQGRVAARVSGAVDATTLRGLVDDVLGNEAGDE
ncbi:TlpA disulfide reductase family protein [uncultured Serinicoccus sp.]|uniref:TlpA family protein disulfide reductase n=1 Tax=uncultured Serinicoccus sp. TaxID=735514 RepID=UPI00262791E3|nr:TlpA disulfide reductase family protein [uncultured Serinicoccus sp.]